MSKTYTHRVNQRYQTFRHNRNNMGPTEKSECWAPNRSNLIIATQLGLPVVLAIYPLIPEFASSLFYLQSEMFRFFCLFLFVLRRSVLIKKKVYFHHMMTMCSLDFWTDSGICPWCQEATFSTCQLSGSCFPFLQRSPDGNQ